MRFIKTWITKSESDTEYCWNKETALRSDEETWRTEEKRHRIQIILSWRKSISLNRQHMNEDEKQEIEKQKHRIIQDC